MKNNFTQAFKALTGFDISASEKAENTTVFTGNDIEREPHDNSGGFTVCHY